MFACSVLFRLCTFIRALLAAFRFEALPLSPHGKSWGRGLPLRQSETLWKNVPQPL